MKASTLENESQNCWEFLNCPKKIREKCNAYRQNSGNECWLVWAKAETGCYGNKKYNGCLNCSWFQKKYTPPPPPVCPACSKD